MTRDNPRRPASSRSTTSRPRKIAGQARPAAGVQESAKPSYDEVPEPPDQHGGTPPRRLAGASESIFGGQAVTRVLVIVLAVMALVIAAQGAWWLVHNHRKDDGLPAAKEGTIAVPPGRPVVLNQGDVDQGVQQAMKDAVLAVSRNWKTYDADVAKAVDVMTSDFATQFKSTTADAKQRYIDHKTVVVGKIVDQGSGVVRANTTQLQALLFLNEWTARGSGKHRRLVLTTFRVLATMVHTDTGWLLSGLDTR